MIYQVFNQAINLLPIGYHFMVIEHLLPDVLPWLLKVPTILLYQTLHHSLTPC